MDAIEIFIGIIALSFAAAYHADWLTDRWIERRFRKLYGRNWRMPR